ncbi:MAG: sialidase family protein [Chloroflexota bacterium]|nr:sialidase family protein [Chloroflexota bacterium]
MVVFDIKPGPGNPRNSEGDTMLLTDDSLLLAWTRFEGAADNAQADIYGMVTDDWGTSWSEPRLLVSREEARQNVMSVSLLREAVSGDIFLFYLRKNSFHDCSVFLRRSADQGRTWGPAQRVSIRDGYHVMNNARVIQLEDGRLLAPVALTQDYDRSRHQVALCYISDDGGAHWRAGSGSVDLPQSRVGCQEPGVVALGDGLLMYIRTDQNYVFGARSADGGETWTLPQPIEDLPAPAAPATMARMPDGSLIVIYNHRPDGAHAGWEGRTPLSVARSRDQGHTWQCLKDIEASAAYAYGYTSFRIYGERVALTYYVWPRDASANFEETALRFRVLPLARFMF